MNESRGGWRTAPIVKLPDYMHTQKEYKDNFKFLIFLVSLIFFWYIGRYFHFEPNALGNFFKKFPLFYSGILFIFLYVIVTFFVWLSKDVFRFAAAFLFGAYISTIFVFIAETINACLLFSFSRFMGKDFIENSIGGKYSGFDSSLTHLSFSWLLLCRAVPLIPFRFMDMAAGLTSISFRKYLWAVILGSPVRIFWLQYILAGVGENMFSTPDAYIHYFLKNKIVFMLSFGYFILVICVALKIKKKNKTLWL